MTLRIHLQNFNEDTHVVTVEYELEKERIPGEAPIYRITYCEVLDYIPESFIVSDIKTDVEETISLHERVDARLRCKIKYAEKLRMQRLQAINPELTFLKVA